jgi:hypothetical protein
MRAVIAFFVGTITAAVVAGLGVLVVQDSQSEQFTFLGLTVAADQGVVVAGAVVVGFILAVLLLLPGRIAGAWHRAHIRQQTRALEERLHALREAHAQLHGGHQRLVEEHGLVLDRVLPSPQSPPSPSSPSSPRSSAPASAPASPPAGQTPHPTPQTLSPTVPAATGAVPSAALVAATAQPAEALSRWHVPPG